MQVCLQAAAGCHDPQPASQRPRRRAGGDAAPASSSPANDRLRIQVERIPGNLNTNVATDRWSWRIAFRTVLEPLVLVGASGEYQPFLASAMSVSAEGRRFRFTLRPNIKFHDDRPLTSADVVYTMESLRKRHEKRRGALDLLGAELAQVVESRAVGDHAVEIVLRRSNYLFPSVLAEIGILPSHLHKRKGLVNPQLNRAPVGTGPFRVGERDQSRRLRLERNEGYWGRPPGLVGVDFVAIPDPAQALGSLRNREIDLVPELHPTYFPQQLKKGHMPQRIRALRMHPYRMRVVVYNLRRKQLRDRRVRVALERLIREIRNNLGQVLSAPFWTLSAWYDQRIHPYSYDRQAAGRLLDAAGWQDAKGKGKRRRLGWPLKLTILHARRAGEGTDRAAAMLKAELRAAGIEAELQEGDFGFILAQLRRGKFDMVLLGLAPRPESDLSPMLHSGGALNLGGYNNPAVDRVLDALRVTPDPGARGRLMGRLHRLLHEDPPLTVLWAPIEIMAVDRRVSGLANNGRWPTLSTLSL